MPSLMKWIGAGLAGLVVAGLVLDHGAAVNQQDKAHVQQAAQDAGAAKADASTAGLHGQQAQALAKPIQADEQAVARRTIHVAQLARLHAIAPAGPGPAAAPAPDATPAPLAQASPLDMAKDQLIAAQAKEITDLKAQNAQLTLEAGSYRQAYRQDDAAVDELGKAVHPNYTRAAGLVYGPGQQAYGVCVDQDISRVRLGVDVLAQQLPAMAGGRVTSLALIRAAWRF